MTHDDLQRPVRVIPENTREPRYFRVIPTPACAVRGAALLVVRTRAISDLITHISPHRDSSLSSPDNLRLSDLGLMLNVLNR